MCVPVYEGDSNINVILFTNDTTELVLQDKGEVSLPYCQNNVAMHININLDAHKIDLTEDQYEQLAGTKTALLDIDDSDEEDVAKLQASSTRSGRRSNPPKYLGDFNV